MPDRLGAIAQANLHRTPEDMEALIAAGVHIRLVKGAYVEPPDRALSYGELTDVAFRAWRTALVEAGASCALGTHGAVLREAPLAALSTMPVEQSLGVRPDVVDTPTLVACGPRLRTLR